MSLFWREGFPSCLSVTSGLLIILTIILLCDDTLILIFHTLQLKNMIAALYSSRFDGTKNFCINGVNFGRDTIEGVYESALYRAQHGISRRVPGLKYAHVVRNNWTRLNVLPAKIMQVYNSRQSLYS